MISILKINIESPVKSNDPPKRPMKPGFPVENVYNELYNVYANGVQQNFLWWQKWVSALSNMVATGHLWPVNWGIKFLVLCHLN